MKARFFVWGFLIRRLSKCYRDAGIRKLLYFSIVRAYLEYASQVWSPYTIKNKILVERATRSILGYPKNMNYKERLSKLGILTLKYWRELADLILFFKCQTGAVDLDYHKYCTKVFDHGYRTRNSDKNNFYVKTIKQDYLKYSFLNRGVCLWNKLPSERKSIETLTLTTFKRKLRDFYIKRLELEYISPI